MAEVFRTPSAVTAGACRQALDVYGEWQGFTAHVDHCGNSIVDVGLVVQVGGAGDLVDTMRRCLQLTAAAHGAQVYPETVILARLRDGQGHVWHADNVRRGSDGWLPNHTPHRDFVGLLYLNDVAAGGRLQFRRSDVGGVVPAAGLYVTFPCGADYVHRVEAVVEGDRFTLAMWFTVERAHAHPTLVELLCGEGTDHVDS